ncbi:MAG: hypothetical protein K6E29_01715 [Cyanobacteria bacterium RUI128]|nr:hypothetical protein [Cyanobacteria bacterium RUI128]
MSSGFADPIRYAVFGLMNTEKANNTMRVDRKERGLVALLQAKNAASDILDLSKTRTGVVAEGLQGVSEGLHAAQEGSKAFNMLCKGVNYVSKLVNPILVGASIVRAWKSDDKKSAALREGGAMTFMLGGEWAYKRLFGLGGYKACYKNFKITDMAVKGAKNIIKSSKFLSKLPMGKFGGLLKALGFIAVSCGMFEIGSKVGQAVANRTTAKTYAENHNKPEYLKTLQKEYKMSA